VRTARAQAGEPDERPGAFLLLPAELASLPVIGTQFEAFTRRATGPRGESRQAHEMRLAVQDAAANIIKHGRMGAAARRLAVQFEFEDSVLQVSLTDQGEPFDPLAVVAALPEGEEPAEGGYGIFLIRALCDEVAYESRAGANTLVLRKLLPAPEETP